MVSSKHSDERVLRPRGDDVVWRRLDAGGVLLDLRTSTYLAINDSATALWERLEQGATRGELVAALRAAFALDEERAGHDVDAFLGDCRTRNLLDEPAGA